MATKQKFFFDFKLIFSTSATHISIHGPWDEVTAPSSSCPLRCRVLELLSSFHTFPRQTPLLGLRHLLAQLNGAVQGGQGQRDAGNLAGEGLAPHFTKISTRRMSSSIG